MPSSSTPKKSDEAFHLLTDARLSEQARVLGLYIRAVGPREIQRIEFARVLHDTPTSKTLRRYLRQLATFGYVQRIPGGRGHADTYRFLDPRENADLNQFRPTNNEFSPTNRPNVGLNGPRPRDPVEKRSTPKKNPPTGGKKKGSSTLHGGRGGAADDTASHGGVAERRKGRTLLPADWMPDDSHREIAAQRGVDIDLEAAKMRDWAASKREFRADWDATFRNWIRNAKPLNNGVRHERAGSTLAKAEYAAATKPEEIRWRR